MPADLVTGASGFIGSHLVEALLAGGRSVRALLRHSSSLQWVPPSVEVVRKGEWSVEELVPILEGIERVFHVAGVTHAHSREGFMRFHVDATRALLAACCRTSSVRRVVLVSSLAAAGPSRTGQPRVETDPPAPVSWYGESKLAQEAVAASFCPHLHLTIVRPPAVYGPRDRDFLPLFRMASRGILPFPGEGSQSLTHVRDIVAGTLAAAEAEVPSGCTYFLSSREIVTWEGLALVLRRVLGRPIRLVRVPPWVLPPVASLGSALARAAHRGFPLDRNKVQEARFLHWTCLPCKAEAELGFRPTVTLAEGIAETIAWYRDHSML